MSHNGTMMIRYALRCANAHDFESWFGSADDFDRLKAAGHVACPDCGSRGVEKALMAPRVTPGRKKAETATPLAAQDPREAALAELRRRVEENSEYVGMNFAAEARRIHEGDAPERSIYGEAKADEARRLIEDGVPVAPLPFLPKARTN
jgi:hypothetical protein